MEQLEKSVSDLERQCEDLRKRIDDFEFWRRVARYLGISLAGVLIFLGSRYREIDQFRLQIEEVAKQSAPLAARLSELSAREDTIELQSDSLDARLADMKRQTATLFDHNTEAGLQGRLLQFSSAAPSSSDPKEAYRQQMRSLTDFGVEYIGYLGENPNGDADSKLYSALKKAAESVKTRSEKQHLQSDWIENPRHFEMILTKFHENPKKLAANDLFLCYEEEIPVWLDRTGVITINEPAKMAKKSPHCQDVLAEPD